MAGVGQAWRRWRQRRRKVEYIAQIEVTECGAACLAMVMAFHDHHVPLAQVREACDVSRDGINAYDLLQAARRYGFQAKAVQLEDVTALAQLPGPAILHWDFNHFVVLERVAGGRAVIVDPALGRLAVSLAEAGRRFTGVVLLFAPQPQLVRRARERPSLAKYRNILLQQWPALALLLLASLGLQLIGLALPAANQLLIDRVIQPQQSAWLWGLGLGLGAAVLGRLLLSLSRSWVLQGLQNALDAGLMQRFLDHLLHLPLAFFLQRQTGDLVQRVQSNTTLRQLFSSQSLSALLDAALLSGYIALMLAYEWRLGLVVSAFGALRVLQLLALRRRNQRIMATELARGGGELGALVEALSGLETTKAAGAEDRLVERWSRHLVASLNSNLQRRYLAINADQLMTVLQGASLAAVFLIGGRAVIEQQMTLGVFAAFLALQALYLEPLESLVRAALQLQFLGNHLRRLDDVLDTPAEPRGGRDPGRLRGGIALHDVSFRYGARAPWVLKNISLQIAPGEKIALVGRSGAGKSSLARLLLGMHAPSSGVVRFDGQDLAGLDLARLRRQMGVVLQETFLFDDTVRANLSLNDDSLPLPRLAAAARAACLEAVIEALPEGYYTRLGENGCRLSGGQRQRLSLARALAHEPAILLLDEATSALDLATEARVHAHLAALDCTRIVIAHRLATVRDADRILVLEQGEIVQQGTYAQLSTVDGLFRQLAESLPAFAREPEHV